MKQTKVINLFSGPGAGKSTVASGLFHNMKRQHISCDAPYEFPKQLAWDESNKIVLDQLFVIANQHRGIVRSYGLVDYIILDSPILLSLVYKDYYSKEYPTTIYGDTFSKMMLEIHNSYDNINIFLNRPKDLYQTDGRFQNLEGAENLDNLIKNMLNENSIDYTSINVNEKSVDKIMYLLSKTL
jgi:hypothetical protein